MVVALEAHSQARAAEHELNLLINVGKWRESSGPCGFVACVHQQVCAAGFYSDM